MRCLSPGLTTLISWAGAPIFRILGGKESLEHRHCFEALLLSQNPSLSGRSASLSYFSLAVDF